MRRKVTEVFERWMRKTSKKCLLVKGCRQVGKTYSILEFAERNYQTVIYLNFEKNPRDKEIFEGDLDVGTIMERIALRTGKSITPEGTILILDEIGYCAEAYSSLKWFTQDGRYDVIASGSLLGILLNKKDDALSPMGFVEVCEMHPMDFEEFLWSMGVSQRHIDHVRDAIERETPIDRFVLNSFNDLFRRHLIVGGMPEAVNEYSRTKDYPKTRKILEDIMSQLKDDVAKYSSKPNRIKILQCLESIPSQLAKENDIFQYGDVEKANASSRKFGSALGWLENAGVAHRSKNLLEPRVPLSVNEREDSFKMFMCDTGLLMTMMDYGDAYTLYSRDPFCNNGAVMECAIAIALVANGQTLRFFRNRDSTMELDFVLPDTEHIVGIEVKSGRKKRSSSLLKMQRTYGNSRGVKLADGNISVDENGTLHLPLFACCFMKEPRPEIPAPDYLDSLSDNS
ncbi:MAG: ATP-binding protein [archaeon]|nr:ATP-binding protein [archaeon]